MEFIKKHRADILLIAGLLLLSLTPLLVLSRPADNLYAEIRIDGRVVRTVQLSAHRGTDTFTIANSYGRNVVRVTDETIAVVDADCPDAICIATGVARRPGDTIACLPHHLIIQVKGQTSGTTARDTDVEGR